VKVSAIHFELPDDREHRSTLPDLSDLIGSFLAAFDGADGAKGCDGQIACRHARNKRDTICQLKPSGAFPFHLC